MTTMVNGDNDDNDGNFGQCQDLESPCFDQSSLRGPRGPKT